MKLSKREKVLIFILIIAVIGYAAYKFLPSTELFNLDALKEENNQKSELYDTMSQNILLKSKYEEKVQTLSDEINNLNVISDIQQENVIVFLNNYFTNNNIDANNISFTDATVIPMSHIAVPGEPKVKSSLETIMGDINGDSSNGTAANVTAEDTKSEQAAAPKEEAAQPTLTARSISVSIAFESTYGDIIKFVDSIQNNAVDISITNVNTISPGGDVLQGTMILNFYGVPKLDIFIEDNEEWLWKDLVIYGKRNPFLVDGSVAAFSNVGSGFDLYMSVLPESSDLPSIMVGETSDRERTSYIYEDSNIIENVTFQFKIENGKYYYNYSTKTSSYPAGGAWNEFVPVASDAVNIKIYSSARNSKTDSAGANIAVFNTTKLKIRFDVEDDDKNNPRIYFKDPKTVIVTRR